MFSINQQPWLKSCIVTVIGDDELGITPEDLERIAAQFFNVRLCLVELALDFDRESGMDGRYVRSFGRFGKSRLRDDRGGQEQERFGSRGSMKMVRCYPKSQLNAYRVELEIHSGLLRRFGIKKCEDVYMATKVFPSHVDFVGVRWGRLARSLARRFGSKGAGILREGRRRRDEVSLRAALRFLSQQGVPNPHRFLKRLKINDAIQVALRLWAERFYTLVGELPAK
jgi:hypothetical protein